MRWEMFWDAEEKQWQGELLGRESDETMVKMVKKVMMVKMEERRRKWKASSQVH